MILKKIAYKGLCCFNYKIVDDKPLIFEMNPRFGASLIRDLNNIIEKQLELVS